MPDKKKQHYVSQMHLRRWCSNDDDIVNLLTLRDGQVQPPSHISNQCQKDYFFGRDFVTDDLVSAFEGPINPLLGEIISSKQPPVKGSEAHMLLLMYTMVFATKTKAEKRKHVGIQEAINQLVEDENLYPPIDQEIPQHAAQISGGLKFYPIVSDLNMTLLVADGSSEFITSDNPVVFYNPWLGHEDEAGHVGLAEKGIMMFLPLDPEHLLVFYDRERYRTRKEKHGSVIVTANTIAEVNALQLFSAENCVYFRNYESAVAALVDQERSNLSANRFSTTLQRRSAHAGDYKIEVPLAGMPRKIDLSPFIEFRYCAALPGSAKKALAHGRVTRDENLVESCQQFFHAVSDELYRVTDYRKFRRDYGV